MTDTANPLIEKYGLIDLPSERERSASNPLMERYGNVLEAPPERPQSRNAPTPSGRASTSRAPARSGARPLPAPRPEEPELTFGEAMGQAGRNLVPSTVNVVKDMASAVMHPGQTLGALRDLGRGALSQAAGAVGVQQDLERKAEAERVVRALEDHYRSSYGSWRGFKRALAEDPASVMMDISTPLTLGGGAAAKGTGLLGRAGRIAESAGRLIDPVEGAIQLAKVPARALTGARVGSRSIPGIATAAQSVGSGASVQSLQHAAMAGATRDPVLREAFIRQVRGQGKPEEIVDAMKAALRQKADERSARYVQDRAHAVANAKPISYQPVFQAINRAKNDITIRDRGHVQVINPKAMQALDEIEDIAREFSSAPQGSVFHSLEGFDALKRRIGDVQEKYSSMTDANRTAYNKATEMYNAVLGAISKDHPEYADWMRHYSEATRELDDISKTFSLGRNAATETALRKLLRSSHNKETLLSELTAKDPRIPYMIAGYELHPLIPESSLKKSLAGLAGLGAWQINPAAAVGSAALSSPRLMGEANYLAGKANRVAEIAGQPAVRAGAYYGARAGAENTDAAPIPAGAEEQDVDALTRMVLGEAASEPETGKAAAVHVALNRAAQSGETPAEVVNAPWQFESVHTGRTDKYDPESPEYQEAKELVLAVLRGEIPDPTEGATFFLNRDLQQQLGRNIPAWAQGDGRQIGQHTFYQGEYRARRASGGRVNHLVGRLMRRADSAKTAFNQSTSPLLGATDDVVAKALSLAQRAI